MSTCRRKRLRHLDGLSSRRTTSTPSASRMDVPDARRCDQGDELRTIQRSVDSESRHISSSQLRDGSDWRSRSTEWLKRLFEQRNVKEYYLRRGQAGPPRSHRPVLMMAGLEKLLIPRSRRGKLHSRNPVNHQARARNHSLHQAGAEWSYLCLIQRRQECRLEEGPSAVRIRRMQQTTLRGVS